MMKQMFILAVVVCLYHHTYGFPDQYYIKPDDSTSSCPSDPCYTLNDYVHQNSSSHSSFTLVFLPGIHLLSVNFTVQLKNVTFETSSRGVSIHCVGDSAFVFDRMYSLQLTNISFVSCGFNSEYGYMPGISIVLSPIVFFSSISITNSPAGAVRIDSSTVYIDNLTCSNNTGNNSGLRVSMSNIIFQGENTFSQNTALNQREVSALSLMLSNMTVAGNLTFLENIGDNEFGLSCTVLFSSHLLVLGEIRFFKNSANLAVYVGPRSTVESEGLIQFVGNVKHQTNNHGTLVVDSSQFIISSNGKFNFSNNYNGFTFFRDTKVLVNGSIHFNKNYLEIENDIHSILDIAISSLSLTGEIEFTNNIARKVGHAGWRVLLAAININGSVSFKDNDADQHTGILVLQSTLHIEGSLMIENNTAKDGFCFALQASHAYLDCTVSISHNTGVNSDAAFVFLLNSQLNVYKQFTLLNNSAGLITSSSNSSWTLEGKVVIANNTCHRSPLYFLLSRISLSSEATISNNVAMTRNGGAINLASSILEFNDSCLFVNNKSPTADGGAIRTVDSTIIFNDNGTFSSNTAVRGGAINLYYRSRIVIGQESRLLFVNNKAQRGGAIHVDDLVSFINCTNEADIRAYYAQPPACFFELETSNNSAVLNFQENTAKLGGSALFGGMLDKCVLATTTSQNALDLFMEISNFSDTNQTISSEPARLCFCENGMPNCSLQTPTIHTRRGESFSVTVTALNDLDVSIAALVRGHLVSSFDEGERILDSEGILQQVRNKCTDLFYRVWSINETEQLVLYAEGPCKDVGNASHTLQIDFTACPVGFVLHAERCVCDSRLTEYTNSCNVDSGAIERPTNFWVGAEYMDNETYNGLILYPNCPFDYCRPLVGVVLTSFNTQCNNKRSDILCGSCDGNTSLVLGSSRCSHCTNYYLFLLVLFALAGIVLVAALFLLKLTVATGTLHGLIFYANIVAANQAVFVPPDTFKGFSVFLAWLNLDLGIETCFYHGMDQYAKTWLQFVFPFYLLALVLAIISVSHFSSRASRLFGSNPVAVLATIILFSYTKILRTILAVFSYATLDYPNKYVTVWLYDGNLPYLQGRHAALFAFALFISIFLFIPYTFLLIFTQLLNKSSRLSSNSLFMKLVPFTDAYHAPYKPAHRYWTGLFLFVRCVLLITVAVNALGDPSINLLAVTTVCFGIGFASWIIGGIYTKRILDTIEAFFILNLGVFAAATYHVKLAEGNQAAVANTSIAFAFAMFVLIVVAKLAHRVGLIEKFHSHRKNTDTQEKTDPVPASPQKVTTQFIPAPVKSIELLEVSNELREPLLES